MIRWNIWWNIAIWELFSLRMDDLCFVNYTVIFLLWVLKHQNIIPHVYVLRISICRKHTYSSFNCWYRYTWPIVKSYSHLCIWFQMTYSILKVWYMYIVFAFLDLPCNYWELHRKVRSLTLYLITKTCWTISRKWSTDML